MATPDVRSALAWSTPSLTVVAIFAVVVGVAWLATIATASNLGDLMMGQVTGSAPVAVVIFLALVGVMMSAMMLPAALPMVSAYRGLASLDSNPSEGVVRTAVFSGMYLLLWLVFTGAALVLLVALGLMGTTTEIGILAPGVVLIGAGIYQFTSWKSYCLARCRTPVGFILEHWRSGRKGAARMGFAHGVFCLGCCWVLMLVVFVTGAMSLLWMAGFSGLVLVEKVWSRGELFSRVIGVVAIVGGIATTGWLALSSGLA